MEYEKIEISEGSYESALVDGMNYLLQQGVDLKPERPESTEVQAGEFDQLPEEELEDEAYLESILANLHQLASAGDAQAEKLLLKLTEKLKGKF